MTFFYRAGWQVQFCEADLKTPLPRTFTFRDPEKIRYLARRGEAWGDSESRQMLEHATETGRGGSTPPDERHEARVRVQHTVELRLKGVKAPAGVRGVFLEAEAGNARRSLGRQWLPHLA